jgi:hypothetical protein
MSSFQLNLSSLTLGAKERLARLEAAGGIKSLLSPPSASAPAVGSGSSASPPSATDASSPGQRVSIERLATAGIGGSGESFVAGGPPAASSPFLLRCRNRLNQCAAVL